MSATPEQCSFVDLNPGWACVLGLLLCAAPAAQAQFTYTTNNGAITITGYTGPGGVVTVPGTLNGLPVASIGDFAFAESDVTSVSIPNSATSIGVDAFLACEGLTSIAVPDSVTNLGEGAFVLCSGLASASIGRGLSNLGDDTFAYCTNLTGVYFMGDAPTPDANVFESDTNATAYYFPGTAGWATTFDGLPTALFPFTYSTNSGEISITKYTGSGGAVAIPSGINNLPVTSIGEEAFIFENSLRSMVIPDSVANIGIGAFDYCRNLTNVSIGNGVTSIGDEAFQNCDSLTNATLGDAVAGIGNEAFNKCPLGSIIIPNSVTNIGIMAFNDCPLSQLTLPNSVINLGNNAFSGCLLTNITFGSNLVSIGDSAFTGCPLASVTLPVSVTSIGSAPFLDCAKLTAINVAAGSPAFIGVSGVLFNQSQTELVEYPEGRLAAFYAIPDSVTSFGEYAFEDCANLASVAIPNAVTSIGQYAFYGCVNMTNVTLGTGIGNLGEQAFGACALTSVTMPDSVRDISDSAFSGCARLASVVMGSGVASIGDHAFYACTSLTNVVVGSGVTSIGEYAFLDCPNLLGVYFLGNAPSGDLTLFGSDTKATAYYLPGTAGWSTSFSGILTAFWVLPYPLILSSGSGFGVASNTFGFTISWATNASAVVDACTDLAHPVWVPLQTNALTGGTLYFADPQWTNYPRRFYRVR